ncbi:MAG: B12-binding domain-containing radical SAM protein [Bacillota bacterium]
MKVLLFRLKPHKRTIGLQSIMICEPLELEYLAASLKGRHQVEIVDMILEKVPLEYFLKLHQPQVVGLTGYISHVNLIKEGAALVKGFDSQITVIVGGVHAEVVPEDFEDQNIDYIVTGNGISVFPKLLDDLESGLVKEVKKSKHIGNKEKSVPEFFPDRELTEKYRSRYYYIFHNPCALIKTSYGCPYSCSFCFCRQITGEQYYTRDLSDVIEEIKGIKESEIYIVDDNFLFSRERVEEFCRLLRENNIHKRFLVYGRADFIAQHEKTIEMFAQVGLRAVIVGMETANGEELEKYNKQSSIHVNEKAAAILLKYGIDCYATIILGIDWHEDDFNNLYKWLKKNNLSFVNLQPFTPLPGTPLGDQYQEQLIIPRSSFEQWDLANLVVRPTRISVRRYYYNILKLYFKLTLSPKSLKGNLKYGLVPNLKLSLGAGRIIWQYLLKIVKGG